MFPGDFSHITHASCQSRFVTISNLTLRSSLIERCSRLSRLVVRWTSDRSRVTQADLVAYHAINMPLDSLPTLRRDDRQQQYSTVYILESEAHAIHNANWRHIDFPIWYNLERSYPVPATYFDLKIYLNHLFAPVRVPFAKKRLTAPIVWMISNW